MVTEVRNQESGARRDVLKDQTFGPKIRFVIKNKNGYNYNNVGYMYTDNLQSLKIFHWQPYCMTYFDQQIYSLIFLKIVDINQNVTMKSILIFQKSITG